MPFPYSKVVPESAEHDDSDTESAPFEENFRSSTFWTRLLSKIKALKWTVVFLLLCANLLCELSVLRRQPSILPIGAELNGLVPRCMVTTTQAFWGVSLITVVSQEYKKFRDHGLYASDHKTMESINATKRNWEDLMPSKCR